MDAKRLWRTVRLWISRDRSAFIRKSHIFAEFGENSTISSRIIPLYPELISIGNNVRIAANVSFITHDMIHAMLNNRIGNSFNFKEHMACIKIDDNVFIGAHSIIIGNTHIGSNVIIGAGTLVNKDLEGGYIYAGVPAKKIGKFTDFVKRREMENLYPDGMYRNGDSIGEDLKSCLWESFNKRQLL